MLVTICVPVHDGPAEAREEAAGVLRAFAELARSRGVSVRWVLGTAVSASGEQAPVDPEFDFTEREREVVRLVCAGLYNREIAEAMFISPKTVERHLTQIFRKAGVRSRAALAALLGAR